MSEHPSKYTGRFHLEQVTFDEMQKLFEELFLKYLIKPIHLFISDVDMEAFEQSIFAYPPTYEKPVRCWTDESRRLTGICSYTTGRVIPVTPIPTLAQGDIILSIGEQE